MGLQSSALVNGTNSTRFLLGPVPAKPVHEHGFTFVPTPNHRMEINATTEERTTYGEICQEGMNFAVSLVHLGLRKGQTVAICSENRSEYFKVVLGVICAGGIITTMNPAYVEDEIRHVMKITKPTFLVCSPNVYKEHSRTFKSLGHIKRIILVGNEKKTGTLSFTDITIPVNNDNDNEERVIVNDRITRNVRYEEFEPVDVKGQIDTAFILYSSGTTGLPKGVMLTHLNLIIMCSLDGEILRGPQAENLRVPLEVFQAAGISPRGQSPLPLEPLDHSNLREVIAMRHE
ncbi:hypothetical protein evm_014294 [Chilo suppressalis]|nr:hypothetical protein evm_014294 [Chilo suppressalis]